MTVLWPDSIRPYIPFAALFRIPEQSLKCTISLFFFARNFPVCLGFCCPHGPIIFFISLAQGPKTPPGILKLGSFYHRPLSSATDADSVCCFPHHGCQPNRLQLQSHDITRAKEKCRGLGPHPDHLRWRCVSVLSGHSSCIKSHWRKRVLNVVFSRLLENVLTYCIAFWKN